MENPFASGLEDSVRARPCVVVIFGATGDLTHRKLIPALYNLGVDGLLPAHFSLIGFARREYSHDSFREEISTAITKFSRRKPIQPQVWEEFSRHSYYVTGAFDDESAYAELKVLLDKINVEAGTECNRVFYLATSPNFFAPIAKHLSKAGLLDRSQVTLDGRPRSRVIVEKPFGNDLASAKALNAELLEYMAEDQIYRIDHYLGKETVQNILVFRFANGIFEPIWNHKYIDHVEISVCETLGVGGRAGYFDEAGILRDIVQNHALQLLCLVALEPPIAFEADAVRDEKVKVLRSIRRFEREEIGSKVIRGRYLAGAIGGEAVAGYLAEKGVNPDSTTDTYVALEFTLDNWRWAGVPFFLRAGKRLPKRVTEISIHFRNVPHTLFREQDVKKVKPNILSFQIQPDEGISLKFSSKPPGPQVRVQAVNMNFSYGTSFGIEPPEAYERLLLDCMRADPTLFTRDDEIEQAWDLLEPVLGAWAEKGNKAPPIFGYEAGTWGPDSADKLLQTRIGQNWRRL